MKNLLGRAANEKALSLFQTLLTSYSMAFLSHYTLAFQELLKQTQINCMHWPLSGGSGSAYRWATNY